MGAKLTYDLKDIDNLAARWEENKPKISHLLSAIALRLEASTHKRFVEEKSPDGKDWIKGQKASGKTLTVSGLLNQSITSYSDDEKAVVGTNRIYAAIHQFGGIIKAKNKKTLHFTINGQDVFVKQVKIPARPFLGISDSDVDSIQNDLVPRFLEGAFE